MPCDTRVREANERRRREEQLKALEQALKSKAAQVAKVGNHVEIRGWVGRGDWCDECAIRALRQSSDFQVRAMIAQAVPAGVPLVFGHTHEAGGHTH